MLCARLADYLPTSPNGKRFAALLLGQGGSYNTDALEVCTDVLNELQSAARLLNQKL